MKEENSWAMKIFFSSYRFFQLFSFIVIGGTIAFYFIFKNYFNLNLLSLLKLDVLILLIALGIRIYYQIKFAKESKIPENQLSFLKGQNIFRKWFYGILGGIILIISLSPIFLIFPDESKIVSPAGTESWFIYALLLIWIIFIALGIILIKKSLESN
jgi:hypothetical protein